MGLFGNRTKTRSPEWRAGYYAALNAAHGVLTEAQEERERLNPDEDWLTSLKIAIYTLGISTKLTNLGMKVLLEK